MDAHAGREAPSACDELEDANGGRDQAPREADPLGLVAVEDAHRREPAQGRRHLPREVDGVADVGIHPLPADGAVDVRGVPEQKHTSLPKARRDAVVHVVRREPVHASDVEAQPIEDTLAHVVPADLLALLLRLRANGPDQTRAALMPEREEESEVALVEREMQLTVQKRTARLDVRDIERCS